jgi:hypothetical protein
LITKADAHRIVETYLAPGNAGRPPGRELVIFDEYTMDCKYGWIFNITTAAFVRTRSRKDGVVGMGPVLVLNKDGSLIQFSSAYDDQEALAAYEANPERFPVHQP